MPKVSNYMGTKSLCTITLLDLVAEDGGELNQQTEHQGFDTHCTQKICLLTQHRHSNISKHEHPQDANEGVVGIAK